MKSQFLSIENEITELKKYLQSIQKNYSSEIYALLDEITSNKREIRNDNDFSSITFAISYLKKDNDLFPDNMEFGLLDDYLVLQFIIYKTIYNYSDSICFASINIFLNHDQLLTLIESSKIRPLEYNEIEVILESKVKSLIGLESKLRTELLQIVFFLKRVISSENRDIKNISTWALTYFIEEEDIINDTTDFGYIDDFLVLKSAELSIKQILYKNFPTHFEYLSDYERCFLPLYFEHTQKAIHLNDFQKIIAMFFFERGLGNDNKNWGIVLPENSALTKTLIYFFYQMGMLAKSFLENVSRKEILERLRAQERILYRRSSKEQFIFSSIEGSRYVFIKKTSLQGRKSVRSEDNDKLLLEEDIILNPNLYEITPPSSKGNRLNTEQNNFIMNFLRLIIANYFKCSLSEIELLDAEPSKIIISPIGRTYSSKEYNDFCVNDIPLSKIMPIATLSDYGVQNTAGLQQSTRHGYITANKINYPDIAVNVIEKSPEEFTALFIDFSSINNYQSNYKKFLSDSGPLSLQKPIFSFFNISQIALNKIIPDIYYAINKELANIISLSVSQKVSSPIPNPFQLLSEFEIENIYVKSHLFELIENNFDKFKEDSYKIKKARDLIYLLSSITNEIPISDIKSDLIALVPDIPEKEISEKIGNHFSEYKKCIDNLANHQSSSNSMAIFTTSLSSDYMRKIFETKNSRVSLGRVHQIQRYPKVKESVIVPFYTRNIYSALLYPIAFKFTFVLDGTKKELHEKRLLHFSRYLDMDSEALLSGHKNENPQPLLEDDFLEEEYIKIIFSEIELKATDNQFVAEKKIEACIISFDDNSNRFLASDSKIPLLDHEDEIDGNESALKKMQVKNLQPGDHIIWYSSKANDFDDSLTGIFLKSKRICLLFKETQKWRSILQELYLKTSSKISSLRKDLNKSGINVTELTLKNWINKEFQVYPHNKEKYIPLIFSLSNHQELDPQRCIDSINQYLSIRHSLGRKIKSFLIHEFAEGTDRIPDIYHRFVDEHGAYIFSKEDIEVEKGLTHILQNIEILRAEKVHRYNEPIPQSWIGRKVEDILRDQ